MRKQKPERKRQRYSKNGGVRKKFVEREAS